MKICARIFCILSGCAVLGLIGCTRSAAYKRDQQYYRTDTEFKNRKGNATAKADRLGQPKKRIYVLPFLNGTPFGGDDLGDFIQVELLREIRDGAKAVIPEDIHSGDASRDFYASDKIRLGPLVREGKRLGVSILIVGKIKKITHRIKGDEVGLFRQKRSVAAVDLEMRMFDVVNGKEILFDEKSADSTSSQVNLFGTDSDDPKSQKLELVQMALRNAAKIYSQDTARALDKISWEGRIAKITGSHIYINAGRATGLTVGDVLKILTAGEDVYDPVTGAYLGRSRGEPKGTLEIVDFLGADGSVATVHSGGNFSENDIVQLY